MICVAHVISVNRAMVYCHSTLFALCKMRCFTLRNEVYTTNMFEGKWYMNQLAWVSQFLETPEIAQISTCFVIYQRDYMMSDEIVNSVSLSVEVKLRLIFHFFGWTKRWEQLELMLMHKRSSYSIWRTGNLRREWFGEHHIKFFYCESITFDRSRASGPCAACFCSSYSQNIPRRRNSILFSFSHGENYSRSMKLSVKINSNLQVLNESHKVLRGGSY